MILELVTLNSTPSLFIKYKFGDLISINLYEPAFTSKGRTNSPDSLVVHSSIVLSPTFCFNVSFVLKSKILNVVFDKVIVLSVSASFFTNLT